MNKRKVFIIAATSYVLAAVLAVALNGFDLNRAVRRSPPCEYSQQDLERLREQGEFACVQTTDYRTHATLSWIPWQFFSQERGHDTVTYLPADIIALIVVGGGLMVVRKIKSHSN